MTSMVHQTKFLQVVRPHVHPIKLYITDQSNVQTLNMQLTFQNVLGQKGLVTYYEKTTKHEYAKQQKDCKKHHLSKSLFKNAKLGPFFCPGGSLPPFLFLNILMRNSPARSRKKRKARRSSTASTSTKAFSNFLHFCMLIYNNSYFSRFPMSICQNYKPRQQTEPDCLPRAQHFLKH